MIKERIIINFFLLSVFGFALGISSVLNLFIPFAAKNSLWFCDDCSHSPGTC